jgi:hypothetical protein
MHDMSTHYWMMCKMILTNSYTKVKIKIYQPNLKINSLNVPDPILQQKNLNYT